MEGGSDKGNKRRVVHKGGAAAGALRAETQTQWKKEISWKLRGNIVKGAGVKDYLPPGLWTRGITEGGGQGGAGVEVESFFDFRHGRFERKVGVWREIFYNQSFGKGRCAV